MSGPIVRKYGFPNFEKIFGERELKHGAEEEASTLEAPQQPAEPPKAVSDPSKDQPGSKPPQA
ncbi:hypothetical protein P12x_000776 [Tundrisphaera lichenicola]|uniref:hypothetical protein n=1 Tax=Tundrisphaera lichenicola TaxID=2029860 RepID=UPI003EC12E84